MMRIASRHLYDVQGAAAGYNHGGFIVKLICLVWRQGDEQLSHAASTHIVEVAVDLYVSCGSYYVDWLIEAGLIRNAVDFDGNAGDQKLTHDLLRREY